MSNESLFYSLANCVKLPYKSFDQIHGCLSVGCELLKAICESDRGALRAQLLVTDNDEASQLGAQELLCKGEWEMLRTLCNRKR